MTMLFMDGFDHYGAAAVGRGHLLDGVYAGVGSVARIENPAWGARTGEFSLRCTAAGEVRKVLPGVETALLCGFGFSVASLPEGNNRNRVLIWSDVGNGPLFALRLQSTGTLELWDYHINPSSPTLMVATAAPVIVPATWHFLEMKTDTVADTFRLDVDGVTVIDASGLAMGDEQIAQITFGVVESGGISGVPCFYDDLTIRNTAGSRNNDFDGDLRIAALYPNADGANQGWTPQYRHKLGTGILNLASTANACVSAASSTSTDMGAGDFTIEGFFRWNALPTTGNKAVLIGKWDESNNRRSYQLFLGGPSLNDGALVFRTSISGAAGTVVNDIMFPWPGDTPDLYTWYHIAIVRSAGELLLFINGVQFGVPIADATTYFVGAAPLGIGAQVEGTATVTANTAFNGWMDELRITVGVARYTANFTPTTVPFPRSVAGGDPDFANVVLLAGFDSGIFDESSYARTLTARNSATAITPDDGDAAFQTINQHAPQDDTFIQAALLAATGTLTLNALPTAGQTVTVGTYTDGGSNAAVYEFKAAVVDPFDVLIGVDEEATLANLIAAINLGAGVGTAYGTGTIINDDVTASGLPSPQMLVTANAAGAAGNAIASTSTLSGGSGWGDTTLDGGADIPGNSEFYFDRPPVNTTLIKAVQIINRSFKSDAGPGSVQASFIGPLGGDDAGADNSLTLTPTYRWDIFETDPDTAGSITPSTIVGGRVRLNRTE